MFKNSVGLKESPESLEGSKGPEMGRRALSAEVVILHYIRGSNGKEGVMKCPMMTVMMVAQLGIYL